MYRKDNDPFSGNYLISSTILKIDFLSGIHSILFVYNFILILAKRCLTCNTVSLENISNFTL